MEIREFKGEFEAVAAVLSAILPDYKQTPDQLRQYYDRREPEYMDDWYVVEEDGTIIGAVFIAQFRYKFHPEKYTISINLHPDVESPVRREEAYQFVLKRLEESNPLALQSKVLSSEGYAVDFLTGHGFVEIMRELNSQLNLVMFDTAPFADLISRLEAEGIHITTVAQLKDSNPDWQQKLFDLDWTLTTDVPSPEPPVKPTLEQYFKRQVDRPDVSLDLWHIALHDGQWVGMTNLVFNQADEDVIYTDLTGVLGHYRRRGSPLP